MAAIIRKVLQAFQRKKAPPLACYRPLDEDENHVHTAACFLDVQSLALAELFQAQGCASCPPAIPGILEATAHPNVQHLTYDVTYFDNQYKDPFGSPRWDQRQKAYARKWGRTNLYTPMVVVNGVADGGSQGGSKAEIDDVVHKAREAMHAHMDWHIFLDANDTHVRIDTDKAETTKHDVLVIVYEDSSETIKIAKGPNKGKKVVHKNVVKDIAKIGEWEGGDLVLPLPMSPAQMAPGTAAVAIVQEAMGGPVIAVCKIV
ncbi:thioredoxin-like protein [Xylariaceae sp. FL1651]|nr:thioredoxin-like protein [Xylariaceae sp. FL1651]